MLMAGQREKKTQSHGRPGWLPGNVSLSESQHEIGSYALCLVTVKPQGEIIPFWGIFVLNYCWYLFGAMEAYGIM